MALFPCPECQKEVSDKAPACPHCGNPLAPKSRWRKPAMIGGVVLLLGALAGGSFLWTRRPDYSRVEQLRAEQDAEGTRTEHVRQRFFRLYQRHPRNAMYIYLWARCVEDAAQQLDLAQQGIRADPRFSWNYNMASRALARLGRLGEAYEQAVKGGALDPGNMQLAQKQRVLKLILDRHLADQAKPAPAEKGARYEGLLRAPIRSPDRADLQAIEKSRIPADFKGPIAEAVRGFVMCANPFADACVRVYVSRDDRLKAGWPPPGPELGTVKEHGLLNVTGAVVTTSKGDSILLADSVTVETQ